MNIDLTQEIKEPNGSPIPLGDAAHTTLGGLIYTTLMRIPADSYEDADHFHDIACEIVGKDTFGFSTEDLAKIQSMVKKLSDTRLRVPGFRMLEIKGKPEAKDQPA